MRGSPTLREALLTALQFLTTLPVSLPRMPTPEEQGFSLLWYPAVGAVLGGLLCGLAFIMPGPVYLQSAVLLAAWVALTGGLHLDGLADCADAWSGGLGDRGRTLELLKDPRCGAMAVLALVLVLLLKYAAMMAVLAQEQAVLLFIAPLLARGALLQLFLRTPYVREGGLGEVLSGYAPRTAGPPVMALTALTVLAVQPATVTIALLIVTALVAFLIRRAALQRLGGFTGDVAGTQVELTETAVLLVAAIAAGG